MSGLEDGSMRFGNARWGRRVTACSLATVVSLVATSAAAQARDGLYLEVHAGPALIVNGRDDGERGGESNDGVESGYGIDSGIAIGAAPRDDLALAGQLGVIGGGAEDMVIIGHAGPMVDWFPGRQRTWHLHVGASCAMGWFGGGMELPDSAPPPADNHLLGAAAFVGGGAALAGSVAPGLFVRTTGAALFGDDTRYYALGIGAGLELMLF
jgi:hypothetical protein